MTSFGCGMSFAELFMLCTRQPFSFDAAAERFVGSGPTRRSSEVARIDLKFGARDSSPLRYPGFLARHLSPPRSSAAWTSRGEAGLL